MQLIDIIYEFIELAEDEPLAVIGTILIMAVAALSISYVWGAAFPEPAVIEPVATPTVVPVIMPVTVTPIPIVKPVLPSTGLYTFSDYAGGVKDMDTGASFSGWTGSMGTKRLNKTIYVDWDDHYIYDENDPVLTSGSGLYDSRYFRVADI